MKSQPQDGWNGLCRRLLTLRHSDLCVPVWCQHLSKALEAVSMSRYVGDSSEMAPRLLQLLCLPIGLEVFVGHVVPTKKTTFPNLS